MMSIRSRPGRVRALRLALAQGITAPLVYLGVIVAGGARRPGYSHFDQAVSELTEAGAPDRYPLGVALVVMELLTIVFGLGYFTTVASGDVTPVARGDVTPVASGDVTPVARGHRRLAASALLLVAIGVVGIGFARFAMDPVGSPVTFDGAMHLGLVAVSAVAAIAAVSLAGFGWRQVPGARGLGRFSLAVLAVMVLSGVASGIVGVQGGPGIGLLQRINTGAFGLWQIATAVFLLRHGTVLRPPAAAG